MKAIFDITANETGAPILPPIRTEEGPQLEYVGQDGQIEGGYTCLSYVPATPGSKVRVEVTASPEVIAWMKSDPANEWIADVPEEVSPV